jgi:hypothetical protein
MILLSEAVNVLSVVLLPIASALLLEELTYGGLVRLLVAPKLGSGKCEKLNDRLVSRGRKRVEPNHQDGGEK